jgi:hypothetical protein
VPNPTSPLGIIETGLVVAGVGHAFSIPIKTIGFVLLPLDAGVGSTISAQEEVNKRIINDFTVECLEKIFKNQL